MGWIDSWQPVAYPCQVGETFRETLAYVVRQTTRLKKRPPPCPAFVPAELSLKALSSFSEYVVAPRGPDCAGSSDSPTIPEFPILDHRAVASREKTLIHVALWLTRIPARFLTGSLASALIVHTGIWSFVILFNLHRTEDFSIALSHFLIERPQIPFSLAIASNLPVTFR